MALLGNTLVLYAFKVFRKLRNVTNYFIVSLATADILVALGSMPVWAAYLIKGPIVIHEIWVQQAWHFIDVLCGAASIIHLCFISLERCICISAPLKHREIVTTGKAVVSIACIWIFAAAVAGIKIIFWDHPPPMYELTVTVTCFIVPLVVMVICYVKIYQAARYQIKKMIFTVEGKPKRFLLSRELKAAKTVGVVIGAFIVCWCPFFVLNLVYGLCIKCRPIPNAAILVAKWMHYVNSVLNPIIYACMNKDFRSAFKKILVYICAFVMRKDYHDVLSEQRSVYSERSSFRNNSCRSGARMDERNSSLRSAADSYVMHSNYNSMERPRHV
ncbi:hypothetical protein QZH41_006493 [Actinostola sp. cb2023]|nr:hypothetical protein QZH41_006493 [Actinostola sp. cb2023]